jgi:predicted ATP-dependent endonuclease of OLD family
MRLSQIDMKNFCLLREASIWLDSKLSTTILVGPNNSGKTSMAETLRLFTTGTGKAFSS